MIWRCNQYTIIQDYFLQQFYRSPMEIMLLAKPNNCSNKFQKDSSPQFTTPPRTHKPLPALPLSWTAHRSDVPQRRHPRNDAPRSFRGSGRDTTATLGTALVCDETSATRFLNTNAVGGARHLDQRLPLWCAGGAADNARNAICRRGTESWHQINGTTRARNVRG